MSVRVEILKAGHGDCILVRSKTTSGSFNLLVDGGSLHAFYVNSRRKIPGELKLRLDELIAENQQIDLLIITHIDDDHIVGLIKGFQTPGYLSDMTKCVWFNSSDMITREFKKNPIVENHVKLESKGEETSVKKAMTLEELLLQLNIWDQKLCIAGSHLKAGPFTFRILSPTLADLKELTCIWPTEDIDPSTAGKRQYTFTPFDELLKKDKFKRDPSTTNRSSIAFILEVEDQRFLLLGDAAEHVIISALKNLDYSEKNKLKVDLVKLSHHGSKHNTSKKLLDVVESDTYIISTNGDVHNHPDRETLARILLPDKKNKIFFNYESRLKEAITVDETRLYGDRIQAQNSWEFEN